jgi:hypothetical protein
MENSAKSRERHEDFTRMARAIEANMETLSKSRSAAGFTGDDEALYASVIEAQKKLLIQLI